MIDRNLLLRLLDNNESMVTRFLNIFKTECPRQLSELRSALESGDFDSASILAHGIKSQCKSVGLNEAAHYCELIEQDASNSASFVHLVALEGLLKEVFLTM
jgi:HPt (histidine-containing phosphotransfer) domain-containing protein